MIPEAIRIIQLATAIATLETFVFDLNKLQKSMVILLRKMIINEPYPVTNPNGTKSVRCQGLLSTCTNIQEALWSLGGRIFGFNLQ